jgi:hypothetical protein
MRTTLNSLHNRPQKKEEKTAPQLLPCFGFRDPLVTLALLFPLPISLSVLIAFSCNPIFTSPTNARTDRYQIRLTRLSAALHGTLGSYLRDPFQEGSAGAVARLPIPQA